MNRNKLSLKNGSQSNQNKKYPNIIHHTEEFFKTRNSISIYKDTETQEQKLVDLITDPLQLKMLILAGTDLQQNELFTLTLCTNLIKLDISSNQIQKFPIGLNLSPLKHLRLFYIHNNLIEDLQSIEMLFNLKNLQYLTIFSNPISNNIGIRHFLINKIPQLLGLDFNIVIDEERYPTITSTDNYYALSQKTNIKWPLIEYPTDMTYNEEQYLVLMRKEIYSIRRLYEQNSAVIKVQRFIRGFLERKGSLKNKISGQNQKVLFAVKKWKDFVKKKRDLRNYLQKKNIIMVGRTVISRKNLDIVKVYVQKVRDRMVQLTKEEQAIRVITKNLKNFQLSSKFFYQKEKQFYFQEDQQKVLSQILKDCLERQRKFAFEQNDNFSKNLFQKLKKIVENENEFTQRNNNLITLRIKEPFDKLQSKWEILNYHRMTLQSKFVVFDENEEKFYQKGQLPFSLICKNKIGISRVKKTFNVQSQYLNEKEIKSFQMMLEKIKKQQNYCYSQIFQLDLREFDEKEIQEIQYQILIYNRNLRFFKSQKQKDAKNQKEQNFFLTTKEIENEKKQKRLKRYENFQEMQFFFLLRIEWIKKISCAIKIQRRWRAFYKTVHFSIVRILREYRSIQKIKKFLLKVPYIHSVNFRKKIELNCSLLREKTFFLEQEIYMNLKQIQKNLLKKKFFKILESNSIINFNPHQGTCRLQWHQRNPFYKLLFENKKKILRFEIPELKTAAPLKLGDLFHILHVSAKVTQIQINGNKFISFEYPSNSEARYRLFALAVMTYSTSLGGIFLQPHSNSFIRDIQNDYLDYHFGIQFAYQIQIEQFLYHDQIIPSNRILKNRIDNEKSLFVCFNLEGEEVIKKSLNNCEHLGIKNLQMFKRDKLQEPLNQIQKKQEEVYIFLCDNIFIEKQNQKIPQNKREVIQYNRQELLGGYDSTLGNQNTSLEGPEEKKYLQNYYYNQKNLKYFNQNQSRRITILSIDTSTLEQTKENTLRKMSMNKIQNQTIEILQESSRKMFQNEQILRQEYLSPKNEIQVDQNKESTKFNSLNKSLEVVDKNILYGFKQKDYNELVLERKQTIQNQNYSKIQQMKKKTEFMKEFRQVEKSYFLNKVKNKFNQEQNQFSDELSKKLNQDLNKKIDVVQKIKSIVKKQSDDENSFLAKFSRNQNFISKQQADFHCKRQRFISIQENQQKANIVKDHRLNNLHNKQYYLSQQGSPKQITKESSGSQPYGAVFKRKLSYSVQNTSQQQNGIDGKCIDEQDLIQLQQKQGLQTNQENSSQQKSEYKLPLLNVVKKEKINLEELNQILPQLELEKERETQKYMKSVSYNVQTLNSNENKSNIKKTKTGPKIKISDKMIHAVFPEEFYPIQTSQKNQFGLI